MSHELPLLQLIRSKASPDHVGARHVISLRDNFTLTSAHGQHLCLVTEVLGSTVLDFRERYKDRQVPVPVVKEITRQILLALDFLHGDCQIIHTGETSISLASMPIVKPVDVDIKFDNMQFAIGDVEKTLSREPHLSVDAAPVESTDQESHLSRAIQSFGSESEPVNPKSQEFAVKLTDFSSGWYPKSLS